MRWNVVENGGVSDAEFDHAMTVGARTTALTLAAYGPRKDEPETPRDALRPASWKVDGWTGPAAAAAEQKHTASAQQIHEFAALDHERHSDRAQGRGEQNAARSASEHGRAELERKLVSLAGKHHTPNGKLEGLLAQQAALDDDHRRTQNLRTSHSQSAARSKKRTSKWRRDHKPKTSNTAGATGKKGVPVGVVQFHRSHEKAGKTKLLRYIGQALDKLGIEDRQARRDWARGYLTLISRESGGVVGAVNGYDSNAHGGRASDGYPANCSRGLAQTIPSTFAANHQPGTSHNIYDPVANIAASMNYVIGRYKVARDGHNLAALVSQANPHHAPQGY